MKTRQSDLVHEGHVTFPGPYTKRLLSELTSYGSSEAGLMGPERKIGFVRKAS